MYPELHLHTNFSFQEGASAIGEMVGHACGLGYEALAITDHDNLCGAMEFSQACRDFGLRSIIGCEVTVRGFYHPGVGESVGEPIRPKGCGISTTDEITYHVTLLSETRRGYANLCWLISQAYREDRRSPVLDPGQFEGHTGGLIALSGCPRGEVPMLIEAGQLVQAREVAACYRDLFGSDGYFTELQRHRIHGETWRNRCLELIADELGVGVVATGNVHYHIRDRHRLQDCLVAIKNNVSLEECHRERRPNSEFFLRPPEAMKTLFEDCPQAIENARSIGERCASFDLSQDLGYEFPDYPVAEGYTPQTYLEYLCHRAAARRYEGVVVEEVADRLEQEFRLVERHNLAGFFLIYQDVVQIAQEIAVGLGVTDPETPVEVNPPGRGRGSSVSMLIGYLLGISHIDPVQYELSLDRFLPDDSLEIVPDIDLDFPRNIREELILRVHEKYGWECAALTGMISTYRIRGVVRDLGKALGLPAGQIDRLAKHIDEPDELSLRQVMLELPDLRDKVPIPGASSGLWGHFLELADQLEGFPKQLAQHPGGMVISSSPLTEIVPVQPSAVDGRYVMHWDKDSIDYARFVKIDFLAIGALSQMQDAVAAIEECTGEVVDLSRIDFMDPAVYDDMQRADTIGVFQIESAAQMQTIARIKPRNLTDMAHEVAAVRPGVGVNQGVHRYVLRRSGLEELTYDHDLEKPILERTWGIILFQDQVNHLAMQIAGFGPTEADRMRRTFTKRHNTAAIRYWWERFRDGALARGVDETSARAIFGKFNGQYMFPESHAFAFGVTAYQGAWLKHYYPMQFFLGLFNQQPMGFYTPETLKEDAKRHGVCILNPDVNLSQALCTTHGNDAIRLGLTYVKGIGSVSAEAIVQSRRLVPFADLADFMARSGLFQQEIENLINAGALDSVCSDRRAARWEVGLRYRPIGAQTSLTLPVEQDMALLQKVSEFDEMLLEYRMMGMHPRGHVMTYVRESLGEAVVTSDEVSYLPDGERIKVAGLVVRRQRPAAAAVFLTLEDEFGHIPAVIWPKTYERFRNDLKAPFLILTGVVSRREETLNIVVEEVRPIRGISNPPKSHDFY